MGPPASPTFGAVFIFGVSPAGAAETGVDCPAAFTLLCVCGVALTLASGDGTGGAAGQLRSRTQSMRRDSRTRRRKKSAIALACFFKNACDGNTGDVLAFVRAVKNLGSSVVAWPYVAVAHCVSVSATDGRCVSTSSSYAENVVSEIVVFIVFSALLIDDIFQRETENVDHRE
jgi:hypothetical protein